MLEQTLTTTCTTLSKYEAIPVKIRVRSKISQISTMEQPLQYQRNKLTFIMQLYQLHTMNKLAIRQWLGDHINMIIFSQSLLYFHFSFLNFLFEKIQPNINVFVSVQLSVICVCMMSKLGYFSIDVYWMVSSDSQCAS